MVVVRVSRGSGGAGGSGGYDGGLVVMKEINDSE